VIEVWEKVKAQEKAAAGKTQSTVFKHLPPQLPALMLAENVWKQIAKAKLPTAGVIDAAQIAALGPQLDQATLGRRLFELTAAARVTGLDPEGALRQETARIMQALEQRAAPSGTKV
jgi:XTP/dITP diphosphohydrolase/tetrapyrrole methylase family protein/MazG family protein